MRFAIFVVSVATLSCSGCTTLGGSAVPSAAPSHGAASATASDQVEAAASAPTEQATLPAPASAEASVEAPASAVATAAGPSLVDTVWEWQATTYSDGSEVTAAAPSGYTIRFLDAAALEVRADCNGVSGSYVVDGDSLELTLGSSTEVACPPGSQADVFLRDLGEVAAYRFENDDLLLVLGGDAGSIRFAAPRPGAAVAEELRGESTLDSNLTAQLDLLLTQGVTPRLPSPLGGASLFPASPGAILLLDTPDGRYLKAAGQARREDRNPMQPGDSFQVGSITKLFVGVLLLQLEEDGVLSLDDPLARWLPDEAARIPGGDRITLRMLANHTAGLADYTDGALAIDSAGGSREQLETQYTPGELIEPVLDQPLLFTPGESGRWRYSNTGYILLGMALERASGRPLDELLAERIFQPLGMNDTRLPDGIPEPGSIVDGYRSFAGENTTRWNTSQAWAAGAIQSSMPDLLAFARALASGAVFRDPATLERMMTVVRSPELAGTGWSGYGIGIAEFDAGVWGHFGRTPGFEAVMMIWPERGTTVIGTANASEGSIAGWQLLLERTIGQ